MRNIKFRVWVKPLEVYWATKEYFSDFLYGFFVAESNGGGADEVLKEEDFLLEQFTGKYDTEGKEIYEGDLVELVYAIQTDFETGEKNGPAESYGVYEVFYDEHSAAFKLKVIKKNWLDTNHVTKEEAEKTSELYQVDPTVILTSNLGKYGICRVIGNIHENPELLQ